MIFEKYQNSAKRTLQCEMTEEQLISNLVFGLAGETGEIADLLKKVIFHKHDLDIVRLKFEIGDLLWYLFMIAEYYNLDMAEIAQMNINKLQARYPNGFNYDDSKNRNDINDTTSTPDTNAET